MASDQPTQRISVFVDSSVLIAAAISPSGAGRELILRGLRGELDLLISSLVIEETERNLGRKAPAALPAFEVFRQGLTNLANPTKAQVLQAAKIIALKDAPIVAAAKRAGASYLASYDQKDLLSQRERILNELGVAVVFPDEVLRTLRAQ
jgi:predicted nucleic acid-binding protein